MRRFPIVACVILMLLARVALAAETAGQAAFPVPIVEMAGNAEQLGQAHAQQLGEPIRNLFAAYFGKYFESPTQKNLSMMAASAFGPHVVKEHKAEIKALANAVELDEREMMLGQCFLDLSAITACSTVTLPASASPDGVARFGRNLDFPSFNVADKQTVLMIFRPEGRYAFASVAWPGMVGVLSGMNEHGLALANMEVDRERRMPVAMPYILLYRTVLERCKTVDEAIELLKTTPRQTPNNLMLMDAAGARAGVEITPERGKGRRAPADAARVSTNHHRGTDLDTGGRCRRYDYLHDASAKEFGQVSRESVEEMLGKVAQGKMTVQSMVFEPSERVIYLAVGKNAPRNGYHKLELQKYFGAK